MTRAGTGTTGLPEATDVPQGLPAPEQPRSGIDPLPLGPDGLTCSAKGCRQGAHYDLRWNNPKIHTPDRRKHWLACTDHRDSLSRFLSARGFLREVVDLPEQDPPASSSPAEAAG